MRLKPILRRWGPTARVISERGWRRRLLHDIVLEQCIQAIAPGATVIDVGAAEGVYSLAMKAAVGRDGRVIAFEPNPVSFRALTRRTWGARIDGRQQAVSDETTKATLHVPANARGANEVGLGSLAFPQRPISSSYVVETIRLDDLLAEDPGRISLIKVDVEGWEDRVLRGASAIVRAHRPVLIVEVEQRHLAPRMIDGASVITSILNESYEVFAISPSGLVPWRAFSFEEHQRVEDLSIESRATLYLNNFLCVPQGRI